MPLGFLSVSSVAGRCSKGSLQAFGHLPDTFSDKVGVSCLALSLGRRKEAPTAHFPAAEGSDLAFLVCMSDTSLGT